MSKSELIEGLRYHVARLQSRKAVDITDEAEYTRPVRLHRRDRGMFQAPGQDEMDVDTKEELANEKERERQEILKAERQRVREENAKLIAPTVNAKRKAPAFKKKTEQVFRANDTPEEQKRSLLRYEEALPWHLEDFDNKHVWEGSFQDAFVGSYVLLMPSPDGHFQLIPVEKRYNFTEQNKVRHLASMEEAEEMMEKKLREPRWVREAYKQQQEKKRQDREAERAKKLVGRKGGRDERFGSDALDQPEEAADADDIDFNYQEDFADDEENELFEGDEETTKEAEKRIQKEQYGANIFSLNDEKEVEAEEERKKKLLEMEKAAGKRTRKMLRSKGGDYTLYESDTDEGPGGLREARRPHHTLVSINADHEQSGSSSSGSAAEEDEATKRDDERKNQDKAKGKERDGDKGSGASSRGTNTPSGRGKTVDLLKSSKSQVVASLKRPGSPNLSDASGNESSRKKIKKTHTLGTATPGALMLGDGGRSRQGSLAPGLPVRKPSTLGVGSASDTDGTGKKITLKLNVRGAGDSRGATPARSRAGSPATQPNAASKNGSGAATPGAAGSTAPVPSGKDASKSSRSHNSGGRGGRSRRGGRGGALHGPSPLSK